MREILQPALEQLETLAQLPANWDSYGADKPSSTAVLAARNFLDSVGSQLGPWFGERIRPNGVVPGPGGSVQLEWRGPSGEVEIEVDATGHFGYWTRQSYTGPQEEREDVDESTALGVLAQVLKRVRS